MLNRASSFKLAPFNRPPYPPVRDVEIMPLLFFSRVPLARHLPHVHMLAALTSPDQPGCMFG